jgi:hypothetical protein
MVSFRLGCALLAFCLAMGRFEVFLEVGVVVFKPVVSVIKVDPSFVDNGVRGINHLLMGEGYVTGLGIGLDVFDVAV